MSSFTIEIFLLALMSISLAIIIVWLTMYYERAQHLRYIKEMISLDEDAVLLDELRKKSKQIPWQLKIQRVMAHAGIEFSPTIFLLLVVLFIGVIGGVLTLFLKHWSGFLIGLPLGGVLVFMFVHSLILRRKKEFNRAFAIAISVLVKMMKTGIGFEQAMSKSIAVSNSAMFKKMFEDFFKEKNTIGEEEAFANIAKHVNSKELLIFAMAVKIGRASGGRFSNTIEKVEQTLVYRKQMQEKVDVVTREGAIGSYIVAGIALFLYFALNLNFDGKLHNYYMNSHYGRFQILAIFLWVFAGLIVNKMIIRIKQ